MNPWERYPEIWKTQSAYMSFIRGGIRRGLWEKNPVKLEFLKNNRFRQVSLDDQGNPIIFKSGIKKGQEKTYWAGRCELTGVVLPIGKMEVDHIDGGHSLKSFDDLLEFIKGIVLISEDDLQLVSKEAHKIKSYSDKMGISFEEARAEKEVIELCKKPVKEVLAWLDKRGYTGDEVSNADKRRKIISKILKGV